MAMDLEGKIRRPRTEFDDERVRYEHRFAPLGQVSTPPLVPYVQFKEMIKVILYVCGKLFRQYNGFHFILSWKSMRSMKIRDLVPPRCMQHLVGIFTKPQPYLQH